MSRIWVWLWNEWRSRSKSDNRWNTFAIKWLCLAVWNPGGTDEVPVDWIGVTVAWADEDAYVDGSLLGFLEEWLLLAWRVYMDIGWGRGIIFSSDERLTPSRRIIFMIKLQNGRIVRVADRAAVFPIIWNMWAQMSIGTLEMRSHKNLSLPKPMKAVYDSGWRLENMISFRVVSSSENNAVPIDDPMLPTSCSLPRTWRMFCA